MGNLTRTAGIFLVSLLLCGCAKGLFHGGNPPPGWNLKAYDGPIRPDDEVATIYPQVYLDTKTGYQDFTRYRVQIYAVDGDRLEVWKHTTPREAKVLPGSHTFSIAAFVGMYHNNLELTLVAKAGHTYEIKCDFVGDGSGRFQCWFDDKGTNFVITDPWYLRVKPADNQ